MKVFKFTTMPGTYGFWGEMLVAPHLLWNIWNSISVFTVSWKGLPQFSWNLRQPRDVRKKEKRNSIMFLNKSGRFTYVKQCAYDWDSIKRTVWSFDFGVYSPQMIFPFSLLRDLIQFTDRSRREINLSVFSSFVYQPIHALNGQNYPKSF